MLYRSSPNLHLRLPILPWLPVANNSNVIVCARGLHHNYIMVLYGKIARGTLSKAAVGLSLDDISHSACTAAP